MTQPRVLNKYRDKIPPDAVDIMRPGPYGNPFRVGYDGTRAEVIEKHRAWLNKMMEEIPLVRYHLTVVLRGHDLVCCCAPLPCHGDYLLAVANGPILVVDGK